MIRKRDNSLFSKQYRAREFDEIVFEVGQSTFTRQQMIDLLHNRHFIAAKTLTVIMARLDVTTANGILRIPMIDWARTRDVGEASLRILLDYLDYADVDGARIDRWLDPDVEGVLHRWSTIRRAAVKTRRRGKHTV